MKYENAKEILPEALLKEVQKYASGKLLYIPIDENRRLWGEASGYREQIKKRNQMIRNKYANGSSIAELADAYFLSLDSLKKIVYEDGKIKLAVDPDRLSRLKLKKINAYPTIILMKGEANHKRFMTHYGRHLIFITKSEAF